MVNYWRREGCGGTGREKKRHLRLAQDGEPLSQTPNDATNLKKVKKKIKVKGRTRKDRETEEDTLKVGPGRRAAEPDAEVFKQSPESRIRNGHAWRAPPSGPPLAMLGRAKRPSAAF